MVLKAIGTPKGKNELGWSPNLIFSNRLFSPSIFCFPSATLHPRSTTQSSVTGRVSMKAVDQQGNVKSPVSEPVSTSQDLDRPIEPDSILNRLLLKAVKRGLAHFGSAEVSDSLLYILELEHSVNVSSLAECIPALRTGLERLFGGAAYVVEQKVRVELASLISTSYEGKTLEQLVEETKKQATEGQQQEGKEQKTINE